MRTLTVLAVALAVSCLAPDGISAAEGHSSRGASRMVMWDDFESPELRWRPVPWPRVCPCEVSVAETDGNRELVMEYEFGADKRAACSRSVRALPPVAPIGLALDVFCPGEKGVPLQLGFFVRVAPNRRQYYQSSKQRYIRPGEHRDVVFSFVSEIHRAGGPASLAEVDEAPDTQALVQVVLMVAVLRSGALHVDNVRWVLPGSDTPPEEAQPVEERFQDLVEAITSQDRDSLLACYRPTRQDAEQKGKQVDLWLGMLGSGRYAIRGAQVVDVSVNGDTATVRASIQYAGKVGPKRGQRWLEEFETSRWVRQDGEWYFAGFGAAAGEILDFGPWAPRDTANMSAQDVASEFVRFLAIEQNAKGALALTPVIDGTPKGQTLALVLCKRLTGLRDAAAREILEVGEAQPMGQRGQRPPDSCTVTVRTDRRTYRLRLRKTVGGGYRVLSGF